MAEENKTNHRDTETQSDRFEPMRLKDDRTGGNLTAGVSWNYESGTVGLTVVGDPISPEAMAISQLLVADLTPSQGMHLAVQLIEAAVRVQVSKEQLGSEPEARPRKAGQQNSDSGGRP